MSNKTLVSVVIPTLNEELTLGICIDKAQQALAKLGIAGEIVVCDSNSTDKTVAIAKIKGAKIVQQPLLGYGNAYKKGIAEAQGEIIIIGDADNTYDFLDIEKFITPLLKNTYDFVTGNRLNRTIERGAMPWPHRYIGTPLMTLTINLLFGTKLRDCNCGLRSFRKTTFEKLNIQSSGWEFASELLIKASLLKLKIKDIDITLYRDSCGRKPHLNPWQAALRNFALIFYLKLISKQLRHKSNY